MLPPLEEYLSGDFQRSHDVRVTDRANTLRIAVWLHRLDAAATSSKDTALSLEAARHGMGPLLQYFLALYTSNLTLDEIVQIVLVENRWEVEDSMEDLRQCQDQLKKELESLSLAHESAGKELKKTLKRKLD